MPARLLHVPRPSGGTIEIKRTGTPTMTPSMVSAPNDLELHWLLVVYPVAMRYKRRPNVEVMSVAAIVSQPKSKTHILGTCSGWQQLSGNQS